MKTYYLREKKRMQATESTSLISPKWEWFEMLSFIDDCSEPLPSEPSLLHHQDIIDEVRVGDFFFLFGTLKLVCSCPQRLFSISSDNLDIKVYSDSKKYITVHEYILLVTI